MTAILDLPTIHVYTATAGQTAFSFGFRDYDYDFVKVWVNGEPATYSATPSNAMQFAVTGDTDEDGGTIIFGAGRTVGDRVVIMRVIPIERVTGFPPTGPVPNSALNFEFDRVISIMQDLARENAQAVRVAVGDSPPPLPPLSQLVGKVLFYDGEAIIGAEIPTNPSPCKVIAETSYMITPADAGWTLVFTAATQVTVTIKENSLVSVGSGIELWQRGNGQLVFNGLPGVTLAMPAGLTRTRSLNSSCGIRLLPGTEVYGIAGDLA